MGLIKLMLTINGAQRMAVCDSDEKLATVLRRMGLIGVKVGCDAGQCGACSVILDGAVVRSCSKKMKGVPDGAEITTIEGIGTPTNLHPLQQAWITYGGVQCGFCSPGFIVSAKGLLDTNASPTRAEVRAWFQKHHNVCRCTGYVPLVDAVMAAAEVMRGEKTMDDVTYKMPSDGKIYGTRFPRRESGVARVTGLANYGSDMTALMPEDTLHLAPVMPMEAHAKILSIDDSEALKLPGVVKVITAKDVKGTNRHALPTAHPRAKNSTLDWPLLNDTKIHRFGDVVALVAADTREHARAAAKAVKVELEVLPEYTSALESVLPDAVPIHEGHPNLYLTTPLRKGEDTRQVFAKAAHVVEGSFHTGREPHLPMEPDIAQAYIGQDGMLTIHCKAQYAYGVNGMIAAGVGLPVEKIRTIQNVNGGAFGYATSPPLPGLVAVACLDLERPVSLELSYPEHQWYTGKRAASYVNGRLAADKDGRLLGYEWDYLLELGGYSHFCEAYISKQLYTQGLPYSIPNQMGLAKQAYSNISYGTPYRAFVWCQTSMSYESLVDMMAEKLGIDPFEFRYRNVARPGDTTPTQVPYHEYLYEGLMDILRPKYEAAVQRAKTSSTPETKRGVGLCLAGYLVGGCTDIASVDLELCPDGSVVNYNTWEDVGQHAESGALLHTYEALRPTLDLPLEKIKTVQNDTKLCPDTGIAGGSRLHYYSGNATADAAKRLVAAMRKDDGTYRTYEEMIEERIPTRYTGTFSSPLETGDPNANDGRGDPAVDYMYAIFMAEVAVEVATGKTKVERATLVEDLGVVGNRQAVEGQAYGGLSHSLGFALKTDYRDVQRHSTMVGAGITEIEDMPDEVELIFHETPRNRGPHGSSGCAETAQSGFHVAVINAINNAVGVRIYELPANPKKVKAGIEAKARGEQTKPKSYYLGADFYQTIDELAENPAWWDSEMGVTSGEVRYHA
jgi:aldehyde oxidoreductase